MKLGDEEVSGDIQIRCLQAIGAREIQGLSDVLIDCVESGASVGFMLPMFRAKAEAFWHNTFESVARDERVLLAAEDTAGTIVGTVQLISISIPLLGSLTLAYVGTWVVVRSKVPLRT